MEKLDMDFEVNDYLEFDDVLDRSYFAEDEMEDKGEDESYYDNHPSDYQSLSEL